MARNLASYSRHGLTPGQLRVSEVVDDQFLQAIYKETNVYLPYSMMYLCACH